MILGPCEQSIDHQYRSHGRAHAISPRLDGLDFLENPIQHPIPSREWTTHGIGSPKNSSANGLIVVGLKKGLASFRTEVQPLTVLFGFKVASFRQCVGGSLLIRAV